eukprot:CAMPEP_0119541556 /NCGR_PEP_ID=MMETSP1344-20130328/53031_1 /TAXON_ID=236787 /ORGANISM="Florenciella parvula, Strain CCMP2471" /LENGTH=67 /DNA_ID=CAMNT_0007585557 /DNA_START=125 /DNA_END=331 /DNA_ORIENTATION=-
MRHAPCSHANHGNDDGNGKWQMAVTPPQPGLCHLSSVVCCVHGAWCMAHDPTASRATVAREAAARLY